MNSEELSPEEQWLDAFLAAALSGAFNRDGDIYALNPHQEENAFAVYKMMLQMLSGTGAQVNLGRVTPLSNTLSVSVICQDIEFTDTHLLSQAVKLAENMDIYPRTDGTVQIDFTFYRYLPGIANIHDT